MEDSHLGALLAANGVRLVPCPSALAFKIEHESDPKEREFDLKRHRKLYDELLVKEHMWQRAHEAEEEIRTLMVKGKLSALDQISDSNQASAAGSQDKILSI